MKHNVLCTFVDKESGVIFASGSFYESVNKERVIELEKGGFIKANQNISSLEEGPKEEKMVKRTRKKASDVDARES